MQVMLMKLMSKGEYLIIPKGTKFKGSGKLGLKVNTLVHKWGSTWTQQFVFRVSC